MSLCNLVDNLCSFFSTDMQCTGAYIVQVAGLCLSRSLSWRMPVGDFLCVLCWLRSSGIPGKRSYCVSKYTMFWC
jgi:hypothetical protein